MFPPTYSLIEADKEKNRENSINGNCNWCVNRKRKMSRNCFDDEFNVHVISSASMKIFGSNTLASFRNFINDEILLSGDWRMALSEIIFLSKLEQVVNGDLIAYSLMEYEDSQKLSSDANVSSRPYNGVKLSFMTGNFDNVNQLLGTVK